MKRPIGLLVSLLLVLVGVTMLNAGVSEIDVPDRPALSDTAYSDDEVVPDFSAITPDDSEADAYTDPSQPAGTAPDFGDPEASPDSNDSQVQADAVDTTTPTATSTRVAVAATSTRAALAATATPAPQPTATRPAPTATPRPAVPLPPLPSTLNIVLLGSDSPPGSPDWRTDVIIVVMVDPKAKRVGVVNLPRDLFVNIPGRSPNRVNTLDEFGGIPLVKKVLGSTLGVPIDYYARIDFNGMIKAIDAIGGITVQVDCALEEIYPDPRLPGGIRRLKVSPGRVRMTGQMALDFSRSRLSTSVWDRMRRQNRVLLGVREKLLSPDIFPRIPALWSATKNLVQTDLPASLIVPLAKLAADIKLSDVHGMTVDYRMTKQTMTPAGAWVLLPNLPTLRATVRNVFTASALTDVIKRESGCG
jgi:polyisoprenyl-teichoic acid--peptidoglycan teichoic acid transferase